MVSALLIVSALACAGAAVAVLAMVPADRRMAAARQAVPAGAVGGVIVIVGGMLSGTETPDYWWGIAFAAVPVACGLWGVLAGAGLWVWMWAVVVFPVSAIVPELAFAGCLAPECRAEDFGGGVALFASAAAVAVFAASVSRGGVVPRAAPLAVLLGCGIVWLVSLEGTVDAYSPRLLAAAAFTSFGGAVAWWLTEVLRSHTRMPGRRALYGALLGFVAVLPGAAVVDLPWMAVVGALAAASGALVVRAGADASGAPVRRMAGAVLVASILGALAPAISGQGSGIIFSGRLGSLVPPVAVLVGVVLLSAAAAVVVRVAASRARR